MRQRKNYSQETDNQSNVIDFIPTEESGWRFVVGDKAFDLRRWFYIDQPVLDESGSDPLGACNANREQFVISVRDALWRLKAKGATNATLSNYVAAGMVSWFRFHDYLLASGRNIQSTKKLSLKLMQQYIAWLMKSPSKRAGRPLAYSSAKAIYGYAKSVFKEVARYGGTTLSIFPLNPFPGAERTYVGATPFDLNELRQVLTGLGNDLHLIRSGNSSLSFLDAATVYFLLVAARTGRNLTPLLEMAADSVEPHPLRENMGVLKLYKRRGSKILRQGFNTQHVQAQNGNASTDVIALIKEFMDRTVDLRQENTALADKVWIYRGTANADVLTLDNHSIYRGIDRFCARHGFRSIGKGGSAVTVSRFRKTFAMHMWHISKGDLTRTAELMGNRPKVTDTHYLSVTPEMEKKHKFVGHILAATIAGNETSPEFVSDLSGQLGLPPEKTIEVISGRANTGVARCSDYLNGRFAPRNGREVCTRFLHCFRCPNQVVMESDLHRLFSFYWLLLKERALLGKNRWKAVYSWVIRVIDRDIAPRFDGHVVAEARDRARHQPHPMWRDRALLVGADAE
jgi:hypothetical protein